MFLESRTRPVRKADNFTAICEPIVYKIWEPRRPIALWASVDWFRDGFTWHEDSIKKLYWCIESLFYFLTGLSQYLFISIGNSGVHEWTFNDVLLLPCSISLHFASVFSFPPEVISNMKRCLSLRLFLYKAEVISKICSFCHPILFNICTSAFSKLCINVYSGL
jgi:hypothetical protein